MSRKQSWNEMVDSFIPVKRAKNGKRFGFVRFINVFNMERLVSNLCAVWIDKNKLQANIARFKRNTTSESFAGGKANSGFRENNMKAHSNENTNVNVKPNEYSGGEGNSYVRVVKGKLKNGELEVKSQPAMVLDDDCLASKDLSKFLIGRVKEFASLANLKMTLSNEGFMDVKIQYMGEFWVMLEFVSEEKMKLFKANVSMGSWFSDIRAASLEFQLSKRIAWVEIEGIPFKLWSSKTFNRIAYKWGELLDVDDQEETCFHSKRLCIHTKMVRSISEEFQIIHRGKIYWVRANETPGWVPDFVDEIEEEDQGDNNINDEDVNEQNSNISGDDSEKERIPEMEFQVDDQEDNYKEEGEFVQDANISEDPFNIYPLLNKSDKKDTIEVGKGMENPSDSIDTNKKCKTIKKSTEGQNDSVSSGHFKVSEIPRTGGSILGILDEVVKVGMVMGYKMEGCMSNMAEIIEAQGAEEVFR
ncbi:nucleotide-binding alpha-beta plait domain-containing protein [Tanacetum coccineum]